MVAAFYIHRVDLLIESPMIEIHRFDSLATIMTQKIWFISQDILIIFLGYVIYKKVGIGSDIRKLGLCAGVYGLLKFVFDCLWLFGKASNTSYIWSALLFTVIVIMFLILFLNGGYNKGKSVHS
jgi:hypothetical protein